MTYHSLQGLAKGDSNRDGWVSIPFFHYGLAEEYPLELKVNYGHSRRITSVALSLDGKSMVTRSRDNTVQLWNLSDGEMIREFKRHSYAVTSVAFSSDTKILALRAVRTTQHDSI